MKHLNVTLTISVFGLIFAASCAEAAPRKKIQGKGAVVADGATMPVTSVNSQDLPSSRELFKQVKDKLLIVQCDDSAGSGFICEMGGRRYFITNRHVISGQGRVAAYFADGKQLKFGKMEIAEGEVDLVRFEVSTNQPALFMSAEPPEMNQNVFVFGNSDGSRVFTDLTGTILGVGPEKIEVSAEFVHGNSGSAVLDGRGCVLGVATFAVLEDDPKDWVKKDTRFTDVRRFALRLENVKWKAMDLKTLNKKIAAAEKARKKELDILPQVRASFKSPSLRINKYQTSGSPRYWVNGNIVLGMSDGRGIKNPVVRVVMLLECGVRRLVMDAVACEPKGKYEYSAVPVFSYSQQNSGWAFDVGNGISVYYLEGLSYYQRPFAYDRVKDVEYFDRAKLLTGGFIVPNDMIVAGKLPKILAFRFECWQNGSLACAYNSVRPATLNSKMIPVDWFVVGRYPKMFDYAAARYSDY